MGLICLVPISDGKEGVVHELIHHALGQIETLLPSSLDTPPILHLKHIIRRAWIQFTLVWVGIST